MDKKGVLRLASGTAVAFGLLAMPLQLTSASEGFVRVNDACGQGALECKISTGYICQTRIGTYVNWRCTLGCAPADE